MADIKIGSMVLGAIGTNCYYIYREGSGDCIFFDPADRADEIRSRLAGKGLSVKSIYLTHGHFDHIWGCNELRELTGAKVHALDAEKDLCESAQLNVSEQAGRAYTVKADEYLYDGQTVTEGDISFKVIGTPGHTAGSCCYYFEDAGILICGDTLFQESVGRTDFPTGSASAIVRSVNEKLMLLPETVRCYPGHGPSTTIGYEKIHNPYVG